MGEFHSKSPFEGTTPADAPPQPLMDALEKYIAFYFPDRQPTPEDISNIMSKLQNGELPLDPAQAITEEDIDDSLEDFKEAV